MKTIFDIFKNDIKSIMQHGFVLLLVLTIFASVLTFLGPVLYVSDLSFSLLSFIAKFYQKILRLQGMELSLSILAPVSGRFHARSAEMEPWQRREGSR